MKKRFLAIAFVLLMIFAGTVTASQHTYTITANTGATFRADVNLALKALASTNSGDSAPNPTWPGMTWYDTLNEKVKIRDGTNTVWNEAWDFGGGGTAITFTNTGLKIQDTDASHTLTIKPGGNLSADRILTVYGDIDLYSSGLIGNLKPVVNATVNKLDIFTKSGGAIPDAANIIAVAIPDGNGYTFRSRAAAYLSGTSQFIMADAANYWSKGSLDAEIKTAYVYAIWDAAGGIVWALGGYSGFTRVPASTTETDDDFFLLEAGSTYTKAVTDYCVCVGKIRYQYDTADTPDHTIQATVLDAPQVIWNPKSDYGYSKNFATTFTQGSNISEASRIAIVVKQSGKYSISATVLGSTDVTGVTARLYIRTGSATYASATQLTFSSMVRADGGISSVAGPSKQKYLNAGDTIHLGISINGTTNMSIIGDDGSWGPGVTQLTFMRVD